MKAKFIITMAMLLAFGRAAYAADISIENIKYESTKISAQIKTEDLSTSKISMIVTSVASNDNTDIKVLSATGDVVSKVAAVDVNATNGEFAGDRAVSVYIVDGEKPYRLLTTAPSLWLNTSGYDSNSKAWNNKCGMDKISAKDAFNSANGVKLFGESKDDKLIKMPEYVLDAMNNGSYTVMFNVPVIGGSGETSRGHAIFSSDNGLFSLSAQPKSDDFYLKVGNTARYNQIKRAKSEFEGKKNVIIVDKQNGKITWCVCNDDGTIKNRITKTYTSSANKLGYFAFNSAEKDYVGGTYVLKSFRFVAKALTDEEIKSSAGNLDK